MVNTHRKSKNHCFRTKKRNRIPGLPLSAHSCADNCRFVGELMFVSLGKSVFFFGCVGSRHMSKGQIILMELRNAQTIWQVSGTQAKENERLPWCWLAMSQVFVGRNPLFSNLNHVRLVSNFEALKWFVSGRGIPQVGYICSIILKNMMIKFDRTYISYIIWRSPIQFSDSNRRK